MALVLQPVRKHIRQDAFFQREALPRCWSSSALAGWAVTCLAPLLFQQEFPSASYTPSVSVTDRSTTVLSRHIILCGETSGQSHGTLPLPPGEKMESLNSKATR